jgi:sulfur carrier protein
MAASIIFGAEKMRAENGVTIEDAMVSAGKHPDAFIFMLKGRPIPMTTVIRDGDIIDAVRVASGG